MRQLGSFLPGTGVGGAGIHWNGMTWRFLPSDFMARSHNLQRYGAGAHARRHDDAGLRRQLRGARAATTTSSNICAASRGKAGNLKGQIQDGGNPFEGPRSREYPNPPHGA